MSRFVAVVGLFFLASVPACSDDAKNEPAGATCSVGAFYPCGCPGGDEGLQECLSDGTFGACGCEHGTGGVSAGGVGGAGSGGVPPGGVGAAGSGGTHVAGQGGVGGVSTGGGGVGDLGGVGGTAGAGGVSIGGVGGTGATGGTGGAAGAASTGEPLVASPQPQALAVSGTQVIWTDTQAWTVSIIDVGGGTPTLLENNLFLLTDVVADDTVVQFLAGSEVVAVPLAGGPSSPVATVGTFPVSVARSDGFSWVGEFDGSLTIVRDNGDKAPAAAVGSEVADVEADGGTAFFVERDGNLWTVEDDGLPATELGATSGDSRALAVGPANVYWASDSEGGIVSTPRSGGPTVPFAGVDRRVLAMRYDSGFVYWVVGSSNLSGSFQPDGRVERAPVSGAMPEVLLSDLHDPRDIVIADGYLVVAESDAGRLVRLALP